MARDYDVEAQPKAASEVEASEGGGAAFAVSGEVAERDDSGSQAQGLRLSRSRLTCTG